MAHVWNEDMDYETLHWKTFPEVLEENNISWKFYQNELSIDVGFKDEQDPWLSNFRIIRWNFFRSIISGFIKNIWLRFAICQTPFG